MGLSRAVWLVLAIAPAATVVPAIARAETTLRVSRRDGAAECPDDVEVRQLALASVASSAPAPAHAYEVSFERAAGAYRADVFDRTAGRTRRLADKGPGCGPLGQAVAQVVATMWSSEGDDAASAPTPSALPAPPVVPEAAAAGPTDPSTMRWVLGAGTALALAIVRPAAPAFFGEGAIELRHAALGIGALWIPTQTVDVPPGSIAVQLVATASRGCAFLGNGTKVGVCAKVLAGALAAEGHGFSTNDQRVRPWFAIGPEVYLDQSVFRWVRYRVGLGAVFPLHEETFSAAGAGTAYVPGVGGLASVSVELVTR